MVTKPFCLFDTTDTFRTNILKSRRWLLEYFKKTSCPNYSNLDLINYFMTTQVLLLIWSLKSFINLLYLPFSNHFLQGDFTFEYTFFFLSTLLKVTPYLSIFSPNARKCGENADQNNSEYGHFFRSYCNHQILTINIYYHSWSRSLFL